MKKLLCAILAAMLSVALCAVFAGCDKKGATDEPNGQPTVQNLTDEQAITVIAGANAAFDAEKPSLPSAQIRARRTAGVSVFFADASGNYSSVGIPDKYFSDLDSESTTQMMQSFGFTICGSYIAIIDAIVSNAQILNVCFEESYANYACRAYVSTATEERITVALSVTATYGEEAEGAYEENLNYYLDYYCNEDLTGADYIVMRGVVNTRVLSYARFARFDFGEEGVTNIAYAMTTIVGTEASLSGACEFNLKDNKFAYVAEGTADFSMSDVSFSGEGIVGDKTELQTQFEANIAGKTSVSASFMGGLTIGQI